MKPSKDAEGFGDPKKPKIAVYIWSQTWFDAPGRQEPVWGEEQPNISFNHAFKGIDIDIRGHAGAIGIRHPGSRGLFMQDITIRAAGAYAGMNNCCGQGGCTCNAEVVDSKDALVTQLEAFQPGSFPHVAAKFDDQTYKIPSSKTCALFVRATASDVHHSHGEQR